MQKILFQAAEAIIIKDKDNIIKKRIKKGYRIPELDEKLRKLRTRSEAKILEKLKSVINVPKVFKSNENTKEIEMEFIDGKKLSEHLDNLKNKLKIAEQIGKEVGKLHDADIIHGDLTTSNMILKNNKVYFIDFGLGFYSKRIEDKAVDLHLIKQALEAKHFKYWKELYSTVIKGYSPKEKSKILEQLKKVELRGRYKH
jgi:TP53 regulating kinase-like protein